MAPVTAAEDFQLFLKWERHEVQLPPETTLSDVEVHREIRTCWNNLTDRHHYIDTLRSCNDAKRAVRTHHARSIRAERELRYWENGPTPDLDANRGAELFLVAIERFNKALEARRLLVYHLGKLYVEQERLGRIDSREYTTSLSRSTSVDIQSTEERLEELQSESRWQRPMYIKRVKRTSGGGDADDQDDHKTRKSERQRSRERTNEVARQRLERGVPISRLMNDTQGAGADSSRDDGRSRRPGLPRNAPAGPLHRMTQSDGAPQSTRRKRSTELPLDQSEAEHVPTADQNLFVSSSVLDVDELPVCAANADQHPSPSVLDLDALPSPACAPSRSSRGSWRGRPAGTTSAQDGAQASQTQVLALPEIVLQMTDSWTDASQFLGGLNRPSSQQKEVFNRLRMWARYLGASGIDARARNLGLDESIDKWLAELERTIAVGQKEYYQWWRTAMNVHIDDEEKDQWIELVNEDKVDLIHEGDEETRTELMIVAWQVIRSKLLKSSPPPSRDTQARLRDLTELAHDERDQHGSYILPPSWSDEITSSIYLDGLLKFMDEMRRVFLKAAWDKKTREAGLDEEEEFEEDAKKAIKPYDDRGICWWPYGDDGDDHVPPESPDSIHVEAMGFDGGRSGIEGKWHYVGELGAGGFGSATLWFELDVDGKPIDRKVIKQCHVPVPEGDDVDRWDTSYYWWKDYRDRIPKEYALAQPLKGLGESYNVIDTLAHSTYVLQRTFRIYLEFCQYGSLSDLVKRYRKERPVKRKTLSSEPAVAGSAARDRIPVRAMWSIFEALASALCLMHNGHLPDTEEPAADSPFIAIMHRDLKPANILLAEGDDIFWPKIPITKVADFGMAHPLSEVSGACGTPGWKAPEMYEYDDDEKNYVRKWSPADIWSVGRVVMALMNLEVNVPEHTYDCEPGYPVPYRKGRRREGGSNELHHSQWFDGVEEFYGVHMCRLVNKCLQDGPADRIDAEELWRAVHGVVASTKGLRGTGTVMRQLPKDSLGAEVLLLEDKYADWTDGLEG